MPVSARNSVLGLTPVQTTTISAWYSPWSVRTPLTLPSPSKAWTRSPRCRETPCSRSSVSMCWVISESKASGMTLSASSMRRTSLP
ncbi:hypothetical protein D3C72_2222760 [compost metagenome]